MEGGSTLSTIVDEHESTLGELKKKAALFTTDERRTAAKTYLEVSF